MKYEVSKGNSLGCKRGIRSVGPAGIVVGTVMVIQDSLRDGGCLHSGSKSSRKKEKRNRSETRSSGFQVQRQSGYQNTSGEVFMSKAERPSSCESATRPMDPNNRPG
jgi:hypothetical protein